ncbi:MAG TPA: ABC transporter permease [Candidatus Merdiplasma excrementigallinarum]|uniref:Autoinducer 2 import system permease protein LsrD n=1 Tax=Candidatus Merdiplasma excrementigallinarum TaxID=2840864 RepID=A0A9D1P0L8_9FIRM|nr:ABC transporter permease [Candidatus Merdiplasma excrementigallinarum]
MKSKRISFNDLSQYMVVISIVLVFGIFAVLNPNFLSPYSLQNLLTEISPLVLLAGGLSFIIFTGGIDLGAGAMVSATCVISGLYVSRFGNGILPVMLVIGFFLGLLNGVIVTKLKIPSFIVTLCTQNLWAFIALYFCPNGSVAVGMDFRKEIAWMTDKVFGIPIIFIVAIAAVIVLYIFQQYTSSGRSIFAVGANIRAARLAGVNTDRAQIMAFVVSGACSSLAGALYAYKQKSAVPTIGDALTLSAIASIALGGTSMAGGRGSVLRTSVGVVTITAITSGLNMMGVDPLWKDIIIGVILIVAVYLNSDTKGRDIIVK